MLFVCLCVVIQLNLVAGQLLSIATPATKDNLHRNSQNLINSLTKDISHMSHDDPVHWPSFGIWNTTVEQLLSELWLFPTVVVI